MKKLKVVIVGGSIAGLTLARLLERAGHAVSVFERSTQALAGRGAGIVTHPGLQAVLSRCGVGTAPDDLGVTVPGRRVLDPEGRIIAACALPQVLAGWGRLYGLLRETLPAGVVHLGADLARVAQDSHGIVAHLKDGRTVEGDCLIGADGQFSTVRTDLLPDVAPAYASYIAWRAMVDEADLTPATQDAICGHFAFCLAPGEQCLGYPVSGAEEDGRPGRRRFNAVWYRPMPLDDLALLSTDGGRVRHTLSIPPNRIGPKVLAEMRADAARVLAPPFAEVMVRAPAPFLQAITDLVTDSMHPAPLVALVGDAAFVARPHVGMGVTKAMEDAAALADALDASGGDIPTAFRAYDARRRPYGAAIVARGRELGASLQAQPRDAERAAVERACDPDAVMRATAVAPTFAVD